MSDIKFVGGPDDGLTALTGDMTDPIPHRGNDEFGPGCYRRKDAESDWEWDQDGWDGCSHIKQDEE